MQQSKRTTVLKKRDLYLQKLIALKDTEPVKVVTGMRRCGKSSLLALMQEYLLSVGVNPQRIIAMNFESMAFQDMTYKDVYAYIKQKIETFDAAEQGANRPTTYLFFDELQRIDRWEDAINSFRVDFNCDIYITGSNAYLLSSEYATYLSGRYVEIKMYPLSFKEFIDFLGYTIEERCTPTGARKQCVRSSKGVVAEESELFDAYMRYGGMPAISEMNFNQSSIMALLEGVYTTVVMRDILDRENRRGQRRITDSELLRRLTLFLADNIGNNTSLNAMCNTLSAEKLIAARGGQRGGERLDGCLDGRSGGTRSTKPAHQTVAAYVAALKESYFFYEIKRFDIKGRDYLRTLGKYYIVDVGLRNYLLGFRDRDRGHALENVVYLELLRRGYDVAVGKIDALEVDFVAQSADEKLYIQVSETMRGDEHRARELRPLEKVRDNYEKIVLTLDRALDDDYNGIRVVNVVDWLLA